MSRREPDNYARRMARAGVAAALIHAAVMVFFGVMGALTPAAAIGPADSDEPLVLNLQPDRESARNFVDTAVPAEDEVRPDTDLISDKASKASDVEDSEGERLAPRLERVSDVDDLAGPMTPAPSAPPQPASPEAAPVEPQPEPQEPADSEEVPDETEEIEALTSLARAEHEMPPLADETSGQARAQMARAQPQPETAPAAPPQPHLGVSKSRADGGAEGKGFVGFEALEHELGPYLKQIRDRVERNWRTALEMRFSGSAKTKAVLECAISPQGKLVQVKIVESGDSPTFALVCKQSIEKASPFPPFPFDVPAIYRTQNLEIRWTFSFL